MNTLFPMTRMMDAALRNFNHTNCAASAHSTDSTGWTRAPRADILDGDKEFQIMMDLPGVSAEQLDINVEHQTLMIKAESKTVVPEGFATLRRERASRTQFQRSFNLGTNVDADNISARLEDGVLQITLPKSEKSLPRRIEVQ